jgi:hypothetical protein
MQFIAEVLHTLEIKSCVSDILRFVFLEENRPSGHTNNILPEFGNSTAKITFFMFESCGERKV